jgi:peroxiredoxin
MLGEPAPSFSLEEVRSGESVSLEDFRGSFIVLHFGASW